VSSIATFPTRFAIVISILRYCHCFASLKVLCHEQMNKYHIISYHMICNTFGKRCLFGLSVPRVNLHFGCNVYSGAGVA